MLNKFIDLERLTVFFQGLKDVFLQKDEASTTYATKIEVDSKVDKVSGKQLSTNDYTTTEKNKLAGVQTGAQVNAVTSVNGQTGAVTTTDTTYNVATTSANGLMSSADKTKINELNYTRAMTQEQYDALSTTEKNRTDVWYGIFE